MKHFIIVLAFLISGFLGTGEFNPITKRYDLKDGTGKRIGTIEKNKIKPDQFDIRDTSGKRTGTIKWNGIRNVWVIEKK